MLFCGRIFSKEHSIGFKGVSFIEKQKLIVKIVRNSHSKVLKNLLNGDKHCEIHFLGI